VGVVEAEIGRLEKIAIQALLATSHWSLFFSSPFFFSDRTGLCS